jgi:membrane-associated protease RseP (regulator of RpoE activity)
MKASHVGSAAVLAVALLGSAPAHTQGGPCDGGRGGWMTDLGFDRPGRSPQTDPATGRVELAHEPPVVVRVEPGSPAERAGIRPGDRLTHVAGVAITGAEGWPRFQAIRPGHGVTLGFARGTGSREAALTALVRP